MKIVRYEEFVRMPAGTIFMPYAPSVFLGDCFEIKVDKGHEYPSPFDPNETAYNFNGVMSLLPWLGADCCDTFYRPGDQMDAKFDIYDGDASDYIQYELFAILEEKDIDQLIKVLEWAKNGCKEECDVCN